MKARQRHARAILGLVVGLAASGSLAKVGAQTQAPLQRGQTPGPRFMVPILRSSEANLGVQAAEALRERMAGDYMTRTLWIIPKTDVVNTLEASGYSVREALNSNDTKQLANLLRAEEYIEGDITRTASGLSFDSRLMLVRGDGMVQPLPVATGSKLGDIAKQTAGEIEKARKQLKPTADCVIAWRQNKYAEALGAAQKGIAAYPRAVMSRVCVLEVYHSQKLGPDSIIRVAEEIVAIHPQNRRALTLVADAYNTKKMDDKYISALTTLLAADPTNVRLQETVVTELARSGKAAIAKPIIDEAVKLNPGDPSLIRLQFAIYRAIGNIKGAIPIGEEMIKTDTASADTVFWQRLAALYAADSQPQKAAEAAARGTAKFPKNANLWFVQAQLARTSGQGPQALEAIRKALAIDPKIENGYLQVAQIYNEMNQPDSALASLQLAVANGGDKTMIAGYSLTLGNAGYRKFNASKAIADAQAALKFLNFSDQTASTANSKFLIGVTNLTMGQRLLEEAGPAKSCDLAKAAKEAFVNAQINLPAGGQAFPKETAAALQGLTQLDPFADRQVKAFCR